MVDHVIIMAGGAGKRLWPASHGSRPKQFMTVQGEESLFCSTVNRAASLNISGKIVVVTHKDHIEAALEDAAVLPEQIRKKLVLLAEPEARNTAPALAYAASWLKKDKENNKASVLVLAADHLIQDIASFGKDVESASCLAARGFLVVYGIQPDFPSTGYGYIEAGAEEASGYKVVSFKEKPDLKKAEEFLSAGNYFWNSGMFTYKLDVFTKELLASEADMIMPFHESYSSPEARIENRIMVVEPDAALTTLYASLPKDSIDYALMEKSSLIAMVQAGFDWNDVGSWDVIADLAPEPAQPVFETGGSGNFVYGDIPVAFCGVDDLIVVMEKGKLLICKKGESQLVKEAAEFFQKS
ncbi:MAG: hypothetical protein B6241_13195 [Spirochaetaceae bacterium 4572_59]|nr:MAG: hypothetical protein B6241_13195 [Spirochaetaceae bacterium 4572_59]